MTATGTEAVSIWAAGRGRWVLQDPHGGTSTHFLWCCHRPGWRGQAGRFMGSFALGWLWEVGLELAAGSAHPAAPPSPILARAAAPAPPHKDLSARPESHSRCGAQVQLCGAGGELLGVCAAGTSLLGHDPLPPAL